MSPDPVNIFERRFANRFGELSRVTDQAVRFAQEHGVGSRPVYLINLTIEEMVTNILKYGYDDAAVHQILLRLEIHPRMVQLVLEDDGHEFNPLRAPEPDVDQPAEDRLPGGLGIHLIRKLVQKMDYQRLEGRNRLSVSIQA